MTWRWPLAWGRTSGTDPLWALMAQTANDSRLISLDLETTSLNVGKAHIVSIGAIAIEGDMIRLGRRFECTVQQRESTAGINVEIHQVRPEDQRTGVALADALHQLFEFIGPSPILGDNVGYDIAILNRLSKTEFGFRLPNRSVELKTLYRRKFRAADINGTIRLQLEHMAAALGIPAFDRHSATGDALTVALCYQALATLS